MLVMVAAGYLAVRYAKPQAPAGRAAAVRTVKASLGDLRRSVRVSGIVGAKEYAAMVAPRMMGRSVRGGGDAGQMVLIKLAKPGARAKKGEIVAEFDRQWQLQSIEDQRAEVAQAEALIAQRKAELLVLREASLHSARTARADMEKARLELKTAEVRSEIDAEKLKLAVEETTARAKQFEEEVRLQEQSHQADLRALEIRRDRVKLNQRRAEINAERMVMRAPLDGIIVMQTTRRGDQPGQVQEGDQVWPGSYFMQIVEPAVMVLNATVNQTESQEFRLGQEAEIRLDAYPKETWPGRLLSMGAMASSSSFGFRGGSRGLYVKQIPVRFSIETRDPRIIPDLSASATVVLAEEKNVIMVPIEALEAEKGNMYVYVRLARGGWERRQVQIGLTNDTHAVVRMGLDAGEEIAIGRPEATSRQAGTGSDGTETK